MMPTLDERRGGAAEQGFSLLEALVAVVLLVLAVAVMFNISVSSQDAQSYADRLSRAVEINQSLINEIRSELHSCVDLGHAGTVDDGYLAAIQIDPTSPMLAGSKLPTAVVSGTFERETTSGERTGNVLLAARQAWTTEFTCTSTRTHRVDVYRLVCYYLTPEGDGPTPGTPVGLNLAKFVSEPLVDAGQVDAIGDATDKVEVLLHLANGTPDNTGRAHPRAVLVWQRGDDLTVAGAMREIDPSPGTLSPVPIAPRPSGAWTIYREPDLSESGLLYYRHYSVATNYAHDRMGVARFGVKDNTGAGFPHGFEVQVGGLSSARQVLLHLSIVSTSGRGIKAHHDMRNVVVVQDL